MRLDRFRAGDPSTLAEVYRAYAPGLARALSGSFTFQSASRTVRFAGATSPLALDDFVQETFVKAFSERARLGYDGLRPYSGYLFGIAKNLVIDEWRRAERFKKLFSEVSHAAPEEAEHDESPEARLMQAQLRAAYRRFEQDLHEAERTLLELRFVQKLTRREVSERTGWSEMQVRVREKRIRQALLAELQGPDSAAEVCDG